MPDSTNETTKQQKTTATAAKRRPTATPKPAGSGERTKTVTKILKRVETKLSKGDVKATLADYIRLVQLQKELDDEAPSEIKVGWVEKDPKSESDT
jgi:hypothetical protein